jgi:hypothetical protein
MSHIEFIGKLRDAGYTRQWSVDAVYDSGCCGAGRITQYSNGFDAVVVQDCGEFGFVVFDKTQSNQVAARLDHEAARRERIRVECEKPVPYGC